MSKKRRSIPEIAGYEDQPFDPPWLTPRKPKIYIDTRDWWVGYYRGDDYHYVCLIPCVVIRWIRWYRR